jgi:hypothetical protein
MQRLRTSPIARRALGALFAIGVALGLTGLAAAPAQAAYTRSFNVISSDHGSASGTIRFTGRFSYTVDAYIYRDSNASVTLKICYWHWSDEQTSWHWDGCNQASAGYPGTTRHVTNLGKNGHWADIGVVTAELFVNGTEVDYDWIYNPYVVH